MTPDGWCTVFSAGLDSLGGQDCTQFLLEIPQNGPKSPRGPPLHVFLSCTSIIFFLVPAQSPKRCYLNPKMVPLLGLGMGIPVTQYGPFGPIIGLGITIARSEPLKGRLEAYLWLIFYSCDIFVRFAGIFRAFELFCRCTKITWS